MYDIIVIGGGAAGMTAALYALRSGRKVLVIEKEGFGGQIANSPRVENFPSIKEISGTEFSDKLFEQIDSLGAEIDFDKVEKVEKIGNTFKVKTEYSEFEGKSVILALGVKHKHTGIKKEEELIGKGVYYCALCDGPFYKGEEVSLIGDANSALQYAIALSAYCKKVKVYTLFDKFFADDVLVKRLKEKENIEVKMGVTLIDMVGEDHLQQLIFKETYGENTFTVDTKALFVAIGQIPDNKAFENIVDLDEKGYIIAGEDTVTKTPGVFVAGDCRVKQIRQLTTATADGAVAATKASNYIDTL